MKTQGQKKFDQKSKIYIGIRYPPKILQRNVVVFWHLNERAQSVHELSDLGKIEKTCYLRTPKELEAHILRIRSTDGYYQHTKYERLTPSELGDRVIFRFWPVFFFKKNTTPPFAKSIFIFALEISPVDHKYWVALWDMMDLIPCKAFVPGTL